MESSESERERISHMTNKNFLTATAKTAGRRDLDQSAYLLRFTSNSINNSNWIELKLDTLLILRKTRKSEKSINTRNLTFFSVEITLQTFKNVIFSLLL